MAGRRRRRWLLALLTAVVAAAAVAAVVAVATQASDEPPDLRVPDGTLDAAAATSQLAILAVAEPGGLAGYDRDCGTGHGCVFGQRWSDDVTVAFGHNGCDTRNDVLARDFDEATVVRRGPCKVIGGTLRDPYTGDTLTFDPDHADAIQVDHVVALAAGWRAGASGWGIDRRRDFANDPRNLLAVAGTTNQQKGEATIDEWAPRAAFRCSYARIVVTIKSHYQLSVSPAEKTTLGQELSGCFAEGAR